MNKLKSIVMSAFFPSSKSSVDAFIGALSVIMSSKPNVIEFYYDGSDKHKIAEAIEKHSIKSIYLAAISLKSKKLNLSSIINDLREEAIHEAKCCIDDAYLYNSEAILINSGKKPEDENDKIKAYEMIEKSVKELIEYSVMIPRSRPLKIYLEPGDTNVEYFDLIGDTDIAVSLVKEIRTRYKDIYLTLDTSHLRQLGEIPIVSIAKAYEFCEHIHLANCIIKNKASALYGDKHPEFGAEGGEYDNSDIRILHEEICNIYKEKELITGIEIICRNNDEVLSFKKIAKEMEWFFKPHH